MRMTYRIFCLMEINRLRVLSIVLVWISFLRHLDLFWNRSCRRYCLYSLSRTRILIILMRILFNRFKDLMVFEAYLFFAPVTIVWLGVELFWDWVGKTASSNYSIVTTCFWFIFIERRSIKRNTNWRHINILFLSKRHLSWLPRPTTCAHRFKLNSMVLWLLRQTVLSQVGAFWGQCLGDMRCFLLTLTHL